MKIVILFFLVGLHNFTQINRDLVIRNQNIICYEKFYDFYSIINNVIYN